MESQFQNDGIDTPRINELELTVFGPGYGESIVLHIPGLGWGVVDSCEFKKSDRRIVPPLEYLIYQKVSKLAFLILSHLSNRVL